MTPKIPRHQSRCVAKEVGGGVTVLLPGRSGSLRWKQFVVKKSPVWFSGPHPINMCGSVVRLIICGVLHTTGFRFMRSGEWSASLISGIKKGDNRLFRKHLYICPCLKQLWNYGSGWGGGGNLMKWGLRAFSQKLNIFLTAVSPHPLRFCIWHTDERGFF